jgi:uncharacterized DUF497 family protein
MKLLGQFEGFEWEGAKRDKNWRRHNVAWWECEEMFFNLPLYIWPDLEHSEKEDRYFAFGQTIGGRTLLVVFTLRGKKIRVISARDMNKRERRFYIEKTEEDSEV